MSITDNQLKGNWGEQFVASQLASQDCLVRHVMQGQDSGVDLYCEKVINGEPLLHFWVQVKTSKDWVENKSYYVFKPKKHHIDYWLKQPIPVYIFLIPDRRKEEVFPYYICRAFDYIIAESKIQSIKKIASDNDLTKYLEDFLVGDIYLWGLKDGTISYFKTQQGRYKRSVITAWTMMFEKGIRKSLILTLYSLSKDYYDHLISKASRIDDPEGIPYFDMLEILITHFDDKHYHNYLLLGDKYKHQGNKEKAEEMYKKSLSILHADPHSKPSDRMWDKEIELVEIKIKSLC